MSVVSVRKDGGVVWIKSENGRESWRSKSGCVSMDGRVTEAGEKRSQWAQMINSIKEQRVSSS